MHLRYRQTCRVCGNPHLVPVIDLGPQYLQGSFVKPGVAQPSRRKIPTRLVRCDVTRNEDACGLVQMSVSTPPEVLYRSYWYESGISATMQTHLARIALEVQLLRPHQRCDDPATWRPGTSKADWSPRRYLDIACNDGTLLSCYPATSIRYGVDPSNIARRATEKASGATIINDLFPTDELIANRCVDIRHPDANRPLQFDGITTIAMFYDLEDPVGFCKAIKQHLKPDGVWVMELAYLPATLKQVAYDAIVGEHLCFYSLATLERVFAMAGLRCFRAETNDINGGSIQCYVSHAECRDYDRPEWTEQLNTLRADEFDLALDTPAPYDLFRSRVEIQRDDLRRLVEEIRAAGGVIHSYGASTKQQTLLQYCDFDHTVIPFAAERSPAKWGAKTLGTDIPIVSEAGSRAMKPSHYLVGPWHFRDEILKREAETIRAGTKFIFPLPTVEVVGAEQLEAAA